MMCRHRSSSSIYVSFKLLSHNTHIFTEQHVCNNIYFSKNMALLQQIKGFYTITFNNLVFSLQPKRECIVSVSVFLSNVSNSTVNQNFRENFVFANMFK